MTYSECAGNYIGVKQGSTKHKKIIDVYNTIKPLPRGYRVKYTDNWCATFVSYILFICGCKRKIYECGAERMRQKCKKYLLDDNKSGQINDIIFYDWNNDKWSDHVGIISEVSKNYYLVIEGNTDRAVGIRKIAKKSDSIISIAHIK